MGKPLNKTPAWVRRQRVIKLADEPLPHTCGGLRVITCWKLLQETPDGIQFWEVYGWKPYDATLYRLREYNPRSCPAEAVLLEEAGFSLYTTNLKLFVKGEAPYYIKVHDSTLLPLA